MNKKQDDIILTMLAFFIDEMCESGISTDEEINRLFNEGNEKEFKKMVKEYRELQSVTRSKAIKTIIRLKKEKLIIKNKYDFQDVVISALRYALGRKTYITKSTVDFVKEYPEIIDKRVKQVMLRDLNNYFEDRIKWEYKDDECDYQVWLSLKIWLENIEV